MLLRAAQTLASPSTNVNPSYVERPNTGSNSVMKSTSPIGKPRPSNDFFLKATAITQRYPHEKWKSNDDTLSKITKPMIGSARDAL